VPEGVQAAARAPLRPRRIAAPSRDALLLMLLALLPWLLGGSWVYGIGVSLANAVGVLSVSVLLRYGGEVSIGHSFFLALGAYAVALMERGFGLSVIAALPVAAATGLAFGLAFAWPSRALSGIYLAVATMALALAVPELILLAGPAAGGYEGLYVARAPLGGVPIDLQRYYLPLGVLAAVVLALARFRRSRQGLALLTARDHPRAAEAFGFSRSQTRLAAFGISAAIAAIAGAMLGFAASTVSPNSFTLWTGIYLLVGSVVSFGSLGLGGALIGGAFITLVPQLLAAWGDWVPILYGLALLGVVLLGDRPAETLARLRARFGTRHG